MAPSDSDSGINVPVHVKIEQGGPFYQDPWFEPHREYFISAVRYLLNKWGENIEQIEGMENVHLYRAICYKHMKEDATIFTHTEDQSNHKILFNVDNLKIQDLHVSSIGNNELLVHGNSIKSDTKIIPKNFRHNLTLSPEAVLSKAQSRLSSDGILTIIIPYEKQGKDRSSSPKENKENINNVIQNKVNQSSSPQLSQNRNSIEIVPENCPNINNCKKKCNKLVEHNEKIFQPYSSPNKKGKCIPMIRRGNFFNDPIFKDSQRYFHEAVSDVLNKCNIQENGDEKDNLEKYRKLREYNLTDETQAIITLENDRFQKIIIDVWDFIANGQLKIKDVEEKHLLVKGRLQKKEEGKDTIKCFKKAFALPKNSSLQRTEFDMSSDGILIITSSKY